MSDAKLSPTVITEPTFEEVAVAINAAIFKKKTIIGVMNAYFTNSSHQRRVYELVSFITKLMYAIGEIMYKIIKPTNRTARKPAIAINEKNAATASISKMIGLAMSVIAKFAFTSPLDPPTAASLNASIGSTISFVPKASITLVSPGKN